MLKTALVPPKPVMSSRTVIIPHKAVISSKIAHTSPKPLISSKTILMPPNPVIFLKNALVPPKPVISSKTDIIPPNPTISSRRKIVANRNDLIQCHRKIDIVYTWVNGSCPRFQRSMMKWSGLLEKGEVKKQSTRGARYYDWDTMKYSLRSVEKYAPCTGNFYIVTNGQIPNWLNLSNPKIQLITHHDIFPNKSHLPTFNSNAIEHHLHRIKGLSEKFLYFNDDVFLSNNITQQDLYFGEDGQQIYTDSAVTECHPGCNIDRTINNSLCNLSCNNTFCNFDGHDCLPKNKEISFETSNKGSDIWIHSLASGNGMLSERFGVVKRSLISHVPNLLDKRILALYTKSFSRYIENTSASKFREGSDIPLSFAYFNFIMSMRHRMGERCDEKCRFRYNTRVGYYGYVEFVGINSNADTVRENLQRWYKQRRKFAFLQDGTSGDNPNNTESHKVLIEHLEMMFPQPSQFEKSS